MKPRYEIGGKDMKAALGNYFNSSESHQQRESVSTGEGGMEQDEAAEDAEDDAEKPEPEGQIKFKKSPVHEQYQPTQPLVASFVLNQVCWL